MINQQIDENLLKKITSAKNINRRIVEVKEAQLKDLEMIFEIITGHKYWRSSLNWILSKDLNEGHYSRELNSLLRDKVNYIKPRECLTSYILEHIDNYDKQMVKIEKGVYKLENFYLTELENRIGRSLMANELYTIEELIKHDIDGRYVERWYLDDLNDEIKRLLIKQDKRIEDMKKEYGKKFIGKNTLEWVKFIYLANEVNKHSHTINVFDFLKKPKTNTEEEKQALNRALSEIKNLYGNQCLVSNKNKIIALNNLYLELYNMSLKDFIEHCIKYQTNDLEKIKEAMMIRRPGLWKDILRECTIRAKKNLKTREGENVDSEAELIIDNFFHQYNIPHKREPIEIYNKNRNGIYIPDWLVNGKIIVEYFGWLDTHLIPYEKKTNEKIRFYHSLIKRGIYFVPLFYEHLKKPKRILLELNKFKGIEFPNFPTVPCFANFSGLIKREF
ncbi:hypothetical protein [Crassaminicella profunda]|uniref:hypothetical protein n=1 Tax=Crassaminicella profunda TaxID=1286698 RepID=UPI001CA763A1|nr:hypothetical protein [Crassaminicella profunda]QZY56657.1 hypothetical protein K7H06_06980 [Crassaminicella profunda]